MPLRQKKFRGETPSLLTGNPTQAARQGQVPDVCIWAKPSIFIWNQRFKPRQTTCDGYKEASNVYTCLLKNTQYMKVFFFQVHQRLSFVFFSEILV